MKNKDIDKNILVIVIGLLSIDYIFKIDHLTVIAYLIGLLSIIIPVAGVGINWIWMKLATILGWINSRILLTGLFFLVLLPIALLRRVFGNDILKLRKEKKNNSLYTVRNHEFTKDDLFETW